MSNACADEVVLPPVQPVSGPGGSTYTHAMVRRTGPVGNDATAYYIYEPMMPTPTSAPVVVFLHGYLGVYPHTYGCWINHLVRSGFVVIYPVYQQDLLSVQTFSANALTAIKKAFEQLAQEEGHVRPDPERRWAIFGHSLGCPIAVNVTLSAAEIGLPPPRALLLTTPGDGNTGIMKSPAGLPDLLLVVVVGDEDKIVGEGLGRRIVREATGVAPANRNLIQLHSDKQLKAGHFGPASVDVSYRSYPEFLKSFRLMENFIVPQGEGVANAHNWFGYWKWGDGLLDGAFFNRNRDYALGNTAAQKFMGLWRDGTPVREPTIEIGDGK